MTDEVDFQKALDADPGSAALRLVFADWLDERGDPRAAGYRWMGENGKHPFDWNTSDVQRGVWRSYDWYMDDGRAMWDVPAHARLPAWLRKPLEATTDWPAYDTRREAEEALFAALLRARPDRPD